MGLLFSSRSSMVPALAFKLITFPSMVTDCLDSKTWALGSDSTGFSWAYESPVKNTNAIIKTLNFMIIGFKLSLGFYSLFYYCLKIFPSFITKITSFITLISISGFPLTAMISASLPDSMVPSFSSTPKSKAPFKVAA